MKINKQERSGNLVTLEVEADRQQFLAVLERTVQRAGQTIKVPGFRPGKAPRQLLEKQLNLQLVEDQAAQDLIAELYPQIIQSAKLEPVDYPSVELVEKKESGPLVFRLRIEVYPEVKLGKYKGIKVEEKTAEATEEEILHLLGNLQNRFGRLSVVMDRGIQEGDVVELDVRAFTDGQDFPSLTRRGLQVQIGKATIDPQFDAQLLGLKAGEMKGFEISFPKDYAVGEVAEKKIAFEVRINRVSQKEVEPLTDEFAQKVSRFSTLAELKEEMRANLIQEKERAVEAEIKDKLIAEIAADTAVEVPQALISREIEMMLGEFERSLKESGLTLEGYLKSTRKKREEVGAEMKGSATTRVKAKLVLQAVAEKEKLEVTTEEKEAEVRRFAEEAGEPFEEFKAKLQEGSMEYIEDHLKRQKALEFVKSHAKISKVKQAQKLFQI